MDPKKKKTILFGAGGLVLLVVVYLVLKGQAAGAAANTGNSAASVLPNWSGSGGGSYQTPATGPASTSGSPPAGTVITPGGDPISQIVPRINPIPPQLIGPPVPADKPGPLPGQVANWTRPDGLGSRQGGRQIEGATAFGQGAPTGTGPVLAGMAATSSQIGRGIQPVLLRPMTSWG